jgi:LysR family transcriptional regulator, glycine cleavage system transcriptional activator
MRRLPSLTALRAFEAVARTLSFTKAAQELGVTQAAVSRQIRLLEEGLAVTLVIRGTTRNALTGAGEILFDGVYRGFVAIGQAVERIGGSGGREILNVSVAPFFSSLWLTPRLMSFYQRHPGIDLRLHHSYQPADHRREGIDLGVNWGSGNWPGVRKELVLDGSLTPVASPDLLARIGPLDTPQQLLDLTLFYEFDIADWTLWLAKAGVAMPKEARSFRLNDSHALRRAALDGHGVALFFRGLVEDDLQSARLVQPFPLAVNTGFDYYLNYADGHELPAKAKAFRRWLLDEVGRQPYA